MASEDPQDQLDEAIKKAERLAEELNQEKDPQAQLDEAIKEAKRLAEELNPEKDPQAQLDEAIKKAERLAEELNQEKDPQAQLDEAINEAKRLAEELNPERENRKKKTNKPPGIRFRWRQRDERGQIVPQTRKATTSTSVAPRASTSRARLVQHLGPVTEEESETRTSGLESTPV
ncbi:uncharacterized protein [Salvelinus sp. IW2-2015]|uniref:uncharacterized protein n=1 Tax=Salvelinus sp. IW2-2015 TaxID=2691554 RepID=UPI0038D35B57